MFGHFSDVTCDFYLDVIESVIHGSLGVDDRDVCSVKICYFWSLVTSSALSVKINGVECSKFRFTCRVDSLHS